MFFFSNFFFFMMYSILTKHGERNKRHVEEGFGGVEFLCMAYT